MYMIFPTLPFCNNILVLDHSIHKFTSKISPYKCLKIFLKTFKHSFLSYCMKHTVCTEIWYVWKDNLKNPKNSAISNRKKIKQNKLGNKHYHRQTSKNQSTKKILKADRKMTHYVLRTRIISNICCLIFFFFRNFIMQF